MRTSRIGRLSALTLVAVLGIAVVTSAQQSQQTGSSEGGGTPPTPVPTGAPPPPSQVPPAPLTQPLERHGAECAPAVAPAPPSTGPAPRGQWIYTTQYGWLWMPYDEPYTYVPPDAAVGYMYVYGPTFGWAWVVAPWVFGLGPMPFWGLPGPVGFFWYGHPLHPGVPFHGHGWREGGFAHGFGGHHGGHG